MEENILVIVRAYNSRDDVLATRYTDFEHKSVCAENLRGEFGSSIKVTCNKAIMCFDGYLSNGDYLGTL